MRSTYFGLLRHGYGENNEAEEKHKRGGDPRAYDEAIKVPSSLHDLTALGCEQAMNAGQWLKRHGIVFDDHVVSGYLRAMRTGVLLNIDGASWRIEERLCEKDSGKLNTLTPSKVRALIEGRGHLRHEQDPYRHRPEDGESFIDLDTRIRPAVDEFRTGTLAVCHGHVIRVIDRVVMAGMSAWEFGIFNPVRGDIPNCALIEYRRANEHSDQWERRFSDPCSGKDPGPWQPIVPIRRSNDELRELVERVREHAKRSVAA